MAFIMSSRSMGMCLAFMWMDKDLADMLSYTSEGLKMQSEDYKYVRERCSLGLKWIYSIGKMIDTIPVTIVTVTVHMQGPWLMMTLIQVAPELSL